MNSDNPTMLNRSSRIAGAPNSDNSGMSLDTGISECSPEHVRILLSEAASNALLEPGECFMIAGRGSVPHADGTRVVLHLVPIPKDQADAACRVAMGTHRAVKIKAKPTT